MMAFCSFGGVGDQCGATSWAAHETGMVPLLSCEINMTAWLKEKYKGSGASGTRIIHAHKWLLSRFMEQKSYFTVLSSQIVCF